MKRSTEKPGTQAPNNDLTACFKRAAFRSYGHRPELADGLSDREFLLLLGVFRRAAMQRVKEAAAAKKCKAREAARCAHHRCAS